MPVRQKVLLLTLYLLKFGEQLRNGSLRLVRLRRELS